MKTVKRIPGKIILVLLLLFASGYLCYVNFDYYFLRDSPLGTKTTFKYVDYAAVDADFNVYRIDHSRQRITKTSPDGKVEFIITCLDLVGENSLISDLVVGEHDKIYIKMLYLDSSASLVTREEILEYSTKEIWPIPRVLISEEYAPGNYVNKPGKFGKLEYRDGCIYFHELKGQTVILRSYVTRTGKEKKVTAIIPGAYDISTIIYLPPENICFVTNQGEIFKTKINSQEVEKIKPYFMGDYNNWQQGSFSEQETGAGSVLNYSNPAYIAIDDKNNIYYADKGKRTINYLYYAPGMLINKPPSESDNAALSPDLQGGQGVSSPIKTNWVADTVFLNESKFRNLLMQNCLPDNIMITKSMMVGNGNLVSVISDNVVIIRDNMNHKKTVSIALPQASYAKRIIYANILMWMFPIIFGITFLYCFIYFYYYCIRRKIIRKQIALFIVVMLLVQVALTYMTYLQIDYILTRQIKKQLTYKVDMAVAGLYEYHPVTGGFSSYLDDLKSIHGSENFWDDSCQNLILYLQEDRNNISNSGDEKKAGITVAENVWHTFASLFTGEFKLDIPKDNNYSIIYLVEEYEPGKHIFHNWVTDQNKRCFYPYFIPNEGDLAKYNRAVNNNQMEFFKDQRDVEGEYIFIIKPFKYMTQYGEQTALYETGMDRNTLNNYESIIFRNTFILVLVILIICTGLIYFLTFRLLFPLRKLKQEVEMLDGKQWSHELDIKTGDELEALARSFNRMNANLKEYVSDIENTKKAYARFVPNQINKYLNKNDIVDIALRDQNTVTMSILMANIREFYSLSKTMSAQDNFDFINRFLERVGPAIPKNNGFVNDFTGFGLISLFPESNQAEGCLQAALEMQRIAKQFSAEQVLAGKEAFEIGIAAHKCVDLILGIVGFQDGKEDRYQATVIHEGAVLTELLERLGAKVGASILVTESIIKDLPNPAEYQFRYLGMFSFDSINEPVNIYDLYQGDFIEINKVKDSTKEDFERGVRLYQEQHFEEAKHIFINIIGANNRDQAAKIYFYLCDEYVRNLPRSWSRAINIG